MKKTIGLWQLWGFALTSLCGTLLHFIYDWTKESVFAAPFSSINESTWEHMKLLFWPMFVFAIVESFFLGERADFWCVKLRGILLGLILIPVIFYTYNGAIGKSPDWVNIAIFFVSAAASYFYETQLFTRHKIRCPYPKLAVAIISAIAIMFVVFTFVTPELAIFQDPFSQS